MKKIFYLIFVLIILLTGCGYTGISLNDVSIDFTDSNSVVVLKREYTERQIIKVYDEEGQALLLMIPYMDEVADQLMANKIIELPDGITDFKIVGFSNNQYSGSSVDVLIETNVGYYAIVKFVSTFGLYFKYYKIDDESIIYSNIKNVIYKDHTTSDKLKIHCNNVIKYASIINKDDSIYFINEEKETLLFENSQIKDSFFLTAYGEKRLDYYNFIIINQNNEIKYCSMSTDQELVIDKDIIVEGKIINFGPIVNGATKMYTDTNNPFEKQIITVENQKGEIIEKEIVDYFYILTDEYVYVYDKLGVEFYKETIEETVYGINFINFGYKDNGIDLQLAYKTNDNLFRWKTKTIGKEEKE
ncbi:MAG: hypothetical protein ACOX4W_02600 [Bacilli bacterium]